eukprot:4422095-Pleurochrysis_carterae.AAC.1
MEPTGRLPLTRRVLHGEAGMGKGGHLRTAPHDDEQRQCAAAEHTRTRGRRHIAEIVVARGRPTPARARA